MRLPLFIFTVAFLAAGSAQAADDFGARFDNRPPAALSDASGFGMQDIEPAAGGDFWTDGTLVDKETRYESTGEKYYLGNGLVRVRPAGVDNERVLSSEFTE